MVWNGAECLCKGRRGSGKVAKLISIHGREFAITSASGDGVVTAYAHQSVTVVGGVEQLVVALVLLAYIAQGIERAPFVELVDGDEIGEVERLQLSSHACAIVDWLPRRAGHAATI